MVGYFGWQVKVYQVQYGWCYIGQLFVFDLCVCGVVIDDDWNGIDCMCGMWVVCLWIDYGFVIVVIGDDDCGVVCGVQCFQYYVQFCVYCFVGFCGGGQVVGMVYYVGIGIVDYDQIIVFGDGLNQFGVDFGCGYFWLQVIGCDFGVLWYEVVFVWFGGFFVVVQEEGDMGVFFGFGQLELVQVFGCDLCVQCVLYLLFGIG